MLWKLFSGIPFAKVMFDNVLWEGFYDIFLKFRKRSKSASDVEIGMSTLYFFCDFFSKQYIILNVVSVEIIFGTFASISGGIAWLKTHNNPLFKLRSTNTCDNKSLRTFILSNLIVLPRGASDVNCLKGRGRSLSARTLSNPERPFR